MRLVSTWAKNKRTKKWECLATLDETLDEQMIIYDDLRESHGILPAKGKRKEKTFTDIVILDSRRPYKKHRLG